MFENGFPLYYAIKLLVEKVGSSTSRYYLHQDYLGSITAITNQSGLLEEEYSYTAWGLLRNPSTWQEYAIGQEPSLMFGRGYTSHEHLALYGLINMNARLYSPLIARFLSPDPYVQSPGFTQNLNRYTYAYNNPLIYTDLTGKWIVEALSHQVN